MVADLQNMKAKPRYSIIDILKGLGIILVVFGHFIEPFREMNAVVNGLYIAVYFFHMPLFCFLSGLVAKFKIKSILRIGFIYGISQTVFLIFSYLPEPTGIKGLIWDVIFPYWHLWYLYAMLFWLTSIFVIDIIKKKVPKILIVGISFGIALTSGFIGVFDRFALTRVITFYPVFLIGYLYKDKIFMVLNNLNNVKSKHIEITSISIFVLLFLLVMLFADKVKATSLWNGQSYSAGGYTLIERVVFYLISSLFVILLIGIFFRFKNRFLEHIGQNTLLVFIFHAFVFWSLKYLGVIDGLTTYKNVVLWLLFSLICTIFCVLVFSYGPIYKLFNKLLDLPIKILYIKR